MMEIFRFGSASCYFGALLRPRGLSGSAVAVRAKRIVGEQCFPAPRARSSTRLDGWRNAGAHRPGTCSVDGLLHVGPKKVDLETAQVERFLARHVKRFAKSFAGEEERLGVSMGTSKMESGGKLGVRNCAEDRTTIASISRQWVALKLVFARLVMCAVGRTTGAGR